MIIGGAQWKDSKTFPSDREAANKQKSSSYDSAILKVTVSLFLPRGQGTASTLPRNELIVWNSEMVLSYQRNGEDFRLLFKAQ